MQCSGTVLETSGGKARVHVETSGCEKCHACGIASMREGRSMEVNALNNVGARSGDTVNLEVPGNRVMSASAVMFLVPFCGFMAGFLLGHFAAWHLFAEQYRMLVSLLLAFALTAASYYPVRVLGRKFEDYGFVIRSIITPEEATEQLRR